MSTLQSPRDALGEYSDCRTGAVELQIPRPTPAMTLATMMWARLKAVDCSKAPIIMMTTAMAMLFLRPSCSPKIAEMMEPMKAPISMIETISPIMVGPGVSKVFWKAGAPMRPPMRPLSHLQYVSRRGRSTDVTYPICMKLKAVSDVTAANKALPRR